MPPVQSGPSLEAGPSKPRRALQMTDAFAAVFDEEQHQLRSREKAEAERKGRERKIQNEVVVHVWTEVCPSD